MISVSRSSRLLPSRSSLSDSGARADEGGSHGVEAR
jgi:hypothetical protein